MVRAGLAEEALAGWLGITPPAARRWWALVADDLAEVRVDTRRLWMHADDLRDARGAPAPAAVHLLPPYDPLLAVADRERNGARAPRRLTPRSWRRAPRRAAGWRRRPRTSGA